MAIDSVTSLHPHVYSVCLLTFLLTLVGSTAVIVARRMCRVEDINGAADEREQ